MFLTRTRAVVCLGLTASVAPVTAPFLPFQGDRDCTISIMGCIALHCTFMFSFLFFSFLFFWHACYQTESSRFPQLLFCSRFASRADLSSSRAFPIFFPSFPSPRLYIQFSFAFFFLLVCLA
ncbi:uncharacterized protein BDV17DRAFT_278147 [Aspergillus undulatus]|uniref:uncharacterized protein n=1 Tax=Aspergillus undulatus TaxID=1810928 RepID=UPI003CCE0411